MTRRWSCSGGDRCPHAIAAFSDMTALKILEAAEEAGVRVPEDVSLVGYDNIEYAALPRIHLTTVSQHKLAAGTPGCGAGTASDPGGTGRLRQS